MMATAVHLRSTNSSVRMTVEIIWRLTIMIIDGYSLYYIQNYRIVPPNISPKPFGRWKYLTNINLAIQFILFTLMSIESIWNRDRKTFQTNKKLSSSLSKMTSFLFYSLAFPVAMFVTISFWSIWSIDRELIFPKIFDKYYPFWLNQTAHTLVAIAVLIELMLARWTPPAKQSYGLVLINLFSYSYGALVLYIAIAHNVWVYPFISKLDWPQRIGFAVAFGLLNSLLYRLAIEFNRRFSTDRLQCQSTASKKR
ncbi:Androgen-induced -like protein [Sarcoptes scabiei]|uniref:Androgen-induced -like protein n=2 Tax=Sarcoptes scabiei TaxID=52283 RepID=A0A834VAL4_SARSC|nr:Androgen-induced -like protein [Sarcoptes scabiei]